MPKTRLTSVDVRAIVSELQHKIIGYRLANFYDINKKSYILKLAKPDQDKIYVIIESGIRLHTTLFEREKNHMPSAFSMKIRKHIRTRRCERVEQLGVDRCVDFQFGLDEQAYHFIVEFYAKGNILLTDHQYRIMAVLRTHKNEEDTRIAVGEYYPVSTRKQFSRMTNEKLLRALTTAMTEAAAAATADSAQPAVGKKQKQKAVTLKSVLLNQFDYGAGFVDHCILRAEMKPSTKLNTLLPSAAAAAVPSSQQLQHAEWIDRLVNAFNEADDFIDACKSTALPGYVVLRDQTEEERQQEAAEEEERSRKQEQQQQQQQQQDAASTFVSNPYAGMTPEQIADVKQQKLYDEFTPFLFQQFQHRPHIRLESFDRTVDKFFSAQEAGQLERKKSALEKNANKKVEKLKREQYNRIHQLERDQRTCFRKATLIQSNADMVDRAIEIINAALAQAIDWDVIREIVREQKVAGDAIASMISGLKLDSNQISVSLQSEFDDEIDEDEDNEDDDDENNDDDDADDDEDDEVDEDDVPQKGKKQLQQQNGQKSSKTGEEEEGDVVGRHERADIDLSMTAHANAEHYFQLMKRIGAKLDKAREATDRAIKTAEKKTVHNLEKSIVSAPEISLMRKKFWFEKFNWFISSENYVCVSGRDAQQNEMLVKRYMQRGDVYVHADIHGAASCIIKNTTQGKEVPHMTLMEAGTFCVCRSSAWDAKIVTSAYWVYDHQVSKTAPSGEYLTTGSFMIRGKKNFLPPNQLIMGIGILFKVDESSLARHVGERRPREQAVEVDADSSSAGDNVQADEAEDDDVDKDEEDNEGEQKEAQTRRKRKENRKKGRIAAANTVIERGGINASEERARRLMSIDDLIEEKLSGVTINDTAVEQQQQSTVPSTTTVQDDVSAPAAIEGEDEEKDSSGGSKAEKKSGSGGLSTKDKRKLKALEKKGIGRQQALEIVLAAKTAGDEKDEQQQRDNESQSAESPAERPQTKQQQQQQQQSIDSKSTKPQGIAKKGKKKGKGKYDDQDEEERRIRMAIMGHPSKDQEPAQQQQQQQKGESGKAATARTTSPTAAAATEKSGDVGNQEQEQDIVDDDEEEMDEGQQGKKRETTKRQRRKQEKMEIEQIIKDENIAVLDENIAQQLSELDSLTGQPKDEDNFLFAIPVCAPYGVLQRYKYKVKLIPGNQKRGKAGQQAFNSLMQEAKRESEKEWLMIKAISEPEITSVMLGNVRCALGATVSRSKVLKAKQASRGKSTE